MSHPFYVLPVSGVSQPLQNSSVAQYACRGVSALAEEPAGASALRQGAKVPALPEMAEGGEGGGRLLPRVVFLGRSLQDYREMFALHDFPTAFKGKTVLDVGAGSATFAAEAAALGISVTAVDPLYGLSVEGLDKRSIQDQETSFTALLQHSKHYAADADQLVALRARREATRRRFMADYRSGLALGRYRQGQLPSLPFANDAFDTALCGNFLFLYGHLFGLDFHLKAIAELLRVARNVRIYPLVGLDSVLPPFGAELLAALETRGDIVAERFGVEGSILSTRVEGLNLTRRQ